MLTKEFEKSSKDNMYSILVAAGIVVLLVAVAIFAYVATTDAIDERNERIAKLEKTQVNSTIEPTGKVIDLRKNSSSSTTSETEPTGKVIDLRKNSSSSTSNIDEDEREDLIAPPGGW